MEGAEGGGQPAAHAQEQGDYHKVHLCTCATFSHAPLHLQSFSYERLEIHDDDGDGKSDPLVRGVYRLDQLVS